MGVGGSVRLMAAGSGSVALKSNKRAKKATKAPRRQKKAVVRMGWFVLAYGLHSWPIVMKEPRRSWHV